MNPAPGHKALFSSRTLRFYPRPAVAGIRPRFIRCYSVRMKASPLVLAALAQAEKSNATVTATLTVHVTDRTAVAQEIASLLDAATREAHESPEEVQVFPHIAALRVKAHPPLIHALLERDEVMRANSGLTQAPFAFGSSSATPSGG